MTLRSQKPDEVARFGFTIFNLYMSVAFMIYAYRIGNRSSKDTQMRDRFARLFTSFTHIETLVLDNFKISKSCNSITASHLAVQRMLRGVSIKRLEIRDNYLNICRLCSG